MQEKKKKKKKATFCNVGIESGMDVHGQIKGLFTQDKSTCHTENTNSSAEERRGCDIISDILNHFQQMVYAVIEEPVSVLRMTYVYGRADDV